MIKRTLMRRVALLVGVAVLLAWPLAGCSSGETPRVTAVRHPVLDNIPLPNGFQLVADRSVGRSSGSFRVAKCEFTGSSDLLAVNRFYREYMPTAGFTLLAERYDRGEYELRYQSDTEECVIRLRPNRMKTAIVIDLGPLPRGPAEAEVKPPAARP